MSAITKLKPPKNKTREYYATMVLDADLGLEYVIGARTKKDVKRMVDLITRGVTVDPKHVYRVVAKPWVRS